MGLPELRGSPMGRYVAGIGADDQLLTAPTDSGKSSVFRDGPFLAAIGGTPRFSDPELAQLQAEAGSAAALLRGYRRDGSSVLQNVHGAFALAILDCEHNSALLAIDRIGIRTLCYAVDDSRLAFGPTTDAVIDLRKEETEPAKIDPQSLFDYLYFHVIPAPTTVFRGVARLPPGYCLRFDANGAKVEAYWQAAYRENDERRFEDLRKEFLDTTRAAVRRSIGAVAPEKVGAFLSGGTDSSTIAGMLGEATGLPANTYSIGFDAAGFDEMEYARIAAKHFATNHHEYYISPDDLADSIPLVAAAYDQPFGNSSALPAYYCARMARRDGIELMLGGDGGDELFGGNTRYAKQRVFGYYESLPGWTRSALSLALNPKAMGLPPVIRKARSYVQQASVPMPERLQTYNLLTRLGYGEVFDPGFLAQVDIHRPLAQLRAEYARCNARSLINRMLAFDLKTTLADNDLPKVVTTCELAGVGAAFPFLDDDVVEFSARLKPEYKLKGLKLRWFFKEALRGFLPDAILSKQKHGFGLPFGLWVGQHPRLRDLAFGSLDSLSKRGIVRPSFVDRLTGEFMTEAPGYYGEMVWILMMLEQWLAAKSAEHAPTG